MWLYGYIKWWNISISYDYIWFSCHAEGKYCQPIQLPILLEVMCKLLSKWSWKRPSREMGVSIYKKLSMKYWKVLNLHILHILGFYNVTKLQALEKIRTNIKIAINTFFSPIFFLRIQKAEKRFTTEVKKPWYIDMNFRYGSCIHPWRKTYKGRHTWRDNIACIVLCKW